MGVGGVQVDAVVVDLPDLDHGVADRLSAGAEDLAREVGDLADGGGDAVVDDEQVVVGIERQLVGVERPLGLWRGLDQFVGEDAGGVIGDCPQSSCAQKAPAVH
jgi:hypothetical protein